ncbi:MAG: ribosome small subunit-dependent GTPase A [Gemmatimonadaceae bacterium]
MTEALVGDVLSGTGGIWHVRTADGEVREASLRGRLKKTTVMKIAVGDEVEVEQDLPSGAWAISVIHPRRSKLARREPGSGYGERVVAANVDQVVVVFAAAKPEPHTRMLDRFLVIAEANELVARVVVNKVDLVPGAEAAQTFSDYEKAGYSVHYTSTKTRAGLDALHDSLAGMSSIFSGPSGVGKSSLLNAMFPGLNLRIGEISESVNKGRHTTVGAVMHPLPDGGYVVDSPGLREVGMWHLAVDAIDSCFPEFRPYLGECKFGDCSHLVEPGCAVRDAVEAGTVSAARYGSYGRLRAELVDQKRD